MSQDYDMLYFRSGQNNKANILKDIKRVKLFVKEKV